MGKPLRVLIVEDSEEDVLLTLHALKKGGYEPTYQRVEEAGPMKKALEKGGWDLILCDYQMPRFNGPAAIALLRETGIDTPLLIVSGAIGEDVAAACMRLGARDYIMKGNLFRLASAVERELEAAESRRQRRQAEKALQESEIHFRTLFDRAPLGYQSLDIGGRFIDVNQAWLDTLGYAREEVIGSWFGDFLAPAYREAFRERFPIFIAEGKIHSEFEMVHKKGHHLFIAFDGRIGRDLYGNFQQTHCILKDITEQKRTEVELLRVADEWQRTFDATGDAIWILDQDHRVLRSNKTSERFFNCPLDEMVGRYCWEIVHGTGRPVSECPVHRVRQSLRRESMELKIGERWLEVIADPILDPDGRYSGAVHILSDITDRRHAEEAIRAGRVSIEKLIEEKTIVAEIGRVVGSTLDLQQVYERVAAEVRKLIPYDRFLVNRKIAADGQFIAAYVTGIENPRRREGDLYQSPGTATHVVMNRRTGILIQPDDAEEIKGLYPNLYESFKTGLRSTMSIPLISMDEVIGTMNFRSKKRKAYTENDLRLAEAIGRQVASAIANAHFFSKTQEAQQQLQDTLESLRRAVHTTIQVMVSAVEARDPYTAGHQNRSADLARAIAIEMGFPQHQVDGIHMAGSIHDIGKISIPAEILSKPTRLSDIELRLIKEHARRGFELLKDVESPWPLAEIVHQHHERLDGSGYPRNLCGDEILLDARILSVADVVEAMASHRPYRPGLGVGAALDEIEQNSGILYDSAAADACIRLFREKGFQLAAIQP